MMIALINTLIKKDIIGFFGPYRWLSNFWYSPIEDGLVYPTLEHAYQAAKTNSVLDKITIQEADSPSIAKQLGKKVKKRADWEQVKLVIMKALLHKKFLCPQLRAKLLSTGEAYLEEANTWGDTFWGTCGGLGQNKLGELLMEVRGEIRAEI